MRYLAIFLLVILAGCKEKPDDEKVGPDLKAIDSIPPRESFRVKYPDPPTISLGKGLFKDSTGTLFLKVKNRRKPSFSGREVGRPDSIFLSRVSLRESNIHSSLLDVLDTASFSRIDDMGVYFQDSALIYVYAIWPYSDQFFALKKAGARFLDKEKEYLLVGGTLYSHGKTVEDIDVKKARVVRFKKTKSKGYREFITDGRVLIVAYYALDEKYLAYIDDISEQDREKIRKRYIKPDSTR